MAGRGNISPGSLLLPLAILILALFFFRAFYAGSGEEQSADQAPVLESRIERVEPPPAAGLQPEKISPDTPLPPRGVFRTSMIL